MAMQGLPCAARRMDVSLGSCRCLRVVGLWGSNPPPTTRAFCGSSRSHWLLASWRRDVPQFGVGHTQLVADRKRVLEKLWREFFSDPSQWWDHRSDKGNLRYPDFKHKKTQESLWLDYELNPAWVEAELVVMAPGTVQVNIFSYNSQLARYVKAHEYQKTMHLFQQMQQEDGLIFDKFTFPPVLKACASLRALEEGRCIHAQIIRSGCESDTYVSSALVHMYAKCGTIEDAWKVFSKMPRRDVVSWNCIILGYVKCGQGKKALDLFGRMQEEGVEPGPVTFVGVLNACASVAALENGRHVHQQIVERGFESGVFVRSSLIDMYAKCGSIDDAWRVFNEMPTRNVVSWNAMIQGYAKSGQAQKALDLFQLMQVERVEPDPGTFVGVLNACACVGALEEGTLLHDQIIQRGFESSVFVRSSLVDMYAKCGNIDGAWRVFNKIPTRNVVSWNAMIQGYVRCGQGKKALAVFGQMQQERMEPDSVTFVGVLNACASIPALEEGRQLHEQIILRNCESDAFICNSLIDMYAKCGSMVDAWGVFNKMPTPDVVAWSAMILGYAKSGEPLKALELYQQMCAEGVEPVSVTFVGVINACGNIPARDEGRRVHEQIIQRGCESNLFVGSSLVDMYAKFGIIEDAWGVFNKMPTRDGVAWSAMILACVRCEQGHEALKLFRQMRVEGVEAVPGTFVGVLNACASVAALEEGRCVHEQILQRGYEADVFVGSSLVNMYSKCGSIKDAWAVFSKMPVRNVISWNAMLGGYALHGLAEEAIGHFEWMCQEGVEMDMVTFVSLLSACNHAGLVDEGLHYFESMGAVYDVSTTLKHYSCMVDLLGRAGRLHEAEDLLDLMTCEPDATIWMSLLSACRVHGNVDMGEHIASRVIELNAGDPAVYVLRSSIYAAAGIWDSTTKIQQHSIERCVNIDPGRTWIELNHEVHSFVVDQEHPQSQKIYAELERVAEQIKVAGYMPETTFGLHSVEEEYKLPRLCHHSEMLAIAYGLISSPAGTPLLIFKDLQVGGDSHTAMKFIGKITGRVITMRDAKRFHQFEDGRCSCGDYW